MEAIGIYIGICGNFRGICKQTRRGCLVKIDGASRGKQCATSLRFLAKIILLWEWFFYFFILEKKHWC